MDRLSMRLQKPREFYAIVGVLIAALLLLAAKTFLPGAFQFVMTVILQVCFWFGTLAAAIGTTGAFAFLTTRAQNILATVFCVLITGLFLLHWGGLVYEDLLHLGSEPIWINWSVRFAAMLFFGSVMTWSIAQTPVPPGHMMRDLLRVAFAGIIGLATLLSLWSWGLGQHALIDWLQGRVPWLLPVFVMSVYVTICCVGLLQRISPRRARWRAYAADAPVPSCPKCNGPMKVRFRHAVCDGCRVLVPIPAEWWICECGAPLRGVKANRCTECGQDFEFDRAMERWMFASGDASVGDGHSSGLLTDSMDKSIDRSAPGERQDPT